MFTRLLEYRALHNKTGIIQKIKVCPYFVENFPANATIAYEDYQFGPWYFTKLPKVKDISQVDMEQICIYLLLVDKYILRRNRLTESSLPKLEVSEIFETLQKILHKICILIDENITVGPALLIYNVLAVLYEILTHIIPISIVELDYLPKFRQTMLTLDKIYKKRVVQFSNKHFLKLIESLVVWIINTLNIINEVIVQSRKSLKPPAILSENKMNFLTYRQGKLVIAWKGQSCENLELIRPMPLKFAESIKTVFLGGMGMQRHPEIQMLHLPSMDIGKNIEMGNNKKILAEEHIHKENILCRQFNKKNISSFDRFKKSFWKQRNRRDSNKYIVPFGIEETRNILRSLRKNTSSLKSLGYIEEYPHILCDIGKILNSFSYCEIIKANYTLTLVEISNDIRSVLLKNVSEVGMGKLSANVIMILRILLHVAATGDVWQVTSTGELYNSKLVWYESIWTKRILLNQLHEIKTIDQIPLERRDTWCQLVSTNRSVEDYMKEFNSGECPTCCNELDQQKSCLLACGHQICFKCREMVENMTTEVLCQMCRATVKEFIILKNLPIFQKSIQTSVEQS